MSPRRFAQKRARILARGRSARHTRRAIAHLAREAGAWPVGAGHKLARFVLPGGFVVCEKRRYASEAGAAAELAGIRAFAPMHEGRKLPRRVYHCPHCKGWHLTSWE